MESSHHDLIHIILRVQIDLDILLKLLARPYIDHALRLRQCLDALYRVVVSLAFDLVIEVLEVVLVLVPFYEPFKGRGFVDFDVRED